jgi:type I restriction enzyme R subunit
VSDEQGEVKRFTDWGLDIIPHRKLMRDGFTVKEIIGGREVEKRLDVETAFKRDDHPFRIVIVCAMWLTGFDVPSLSTLYLDKPLQAHTLMQAIARANRVKDGKNNGLIVDYCGILKNLRKALATFAGHTGGNPIGGSGGIIEGGPPQVDPLNPGETLLAELAEAIGLARELLTAEGYDLDRMKDASGFNKLKALQDAKELINTNDETRKGFEITCRAVFRKYKACLTFERVENFKSDYQAINYIYSSLQEDKATADTAAIIQKLNAIVAEAITIQADSDEDRIFDISKVNFDRLREEFAKSYRKAGDVQDLRSVLQKRLAKMIAANPTLTNFQERFDAIIVEYNKEKDKNTIEAIFEALMLLSAGLESEAQAHVALGLTADQKPVFDLLVQDDLSKDEIKQIKSASIELLNAISQKIKSVQGIFQKQSTRDGLRQNIYDRLYDERTGLPAAKYDETALEIKTDTLFQFFEKTQGYTANLELQ